MLNKQFRISCSGLYRHPAVHWLMGESLHPGGLTLTRRLAEKMGLTQGNLVLDVATSRGATPGFLAGELGCRVVGIDLVTDSLARALEDSKGRHLDRAAHYVAGDAESLPIASGTVDAVICECSLSIFPDKPQAVREMARVLRPGGAIGISDVTRSVELPDSLRGVISQVACLADVKRPEDYMALLSEAGLEDIRVEDHGEELKALAGAIKKKLGPLGLMMKMGAVKVPQIGLDLGSSVKDLLSEADRLIQDGGLSYCLITGRKPAYREASIAPVLGSCEV